MYRKPIGTKDLSESGRIILAHGEQTGHHHEVLDMCKLAVKEMSAYLPEGYQPCSDLPAAQFFEEPDGRRVLLCLAPCVLQHEEHARIALDPTTPTMVRQGDVLLLPIGEGAWELRRQSDYTPAAIRSVAD